MSAQHTPTLPEGYDLEQDQDGDWWLFPPESVTIFSVPGEGWLVTDDYMNGRDWNNRNDILKACIDYLAAIAKAEGRS